MAERPARDLDAGDERAVGVVPQRRVERPEVVQPFLGEEAFRNDHSVVRSRSVALREQEAVVVSEDAVVEHPEHIERRERARVVLLVAVQAVEQPGQILVAERARSRHDGTVQLQLVFKSSAG
jgi:hypothetical protein